MRLQLDPAVTGTGINRSNEAVPTPPSGGYDSRRIGGDAAGSDSIRISGPSSALASVAADRAARVQQLTAQVQAGTYNVPSSLISQALISQTAVAQGTALPGSAWTGADE
jgi:anti-sigma28 factor (negative regulator of flagellin synthesis)